MGTLLVTVAWRGRRRDFAVPTDVPIADLLRPLAAAMCAGNGAPPSGTTSPPQTHPGTQTHPGGGAVGNTAAGVETGAFGSGRARSARVHPGAELALAPLGGAPLPAHTTLAACGVGHGAVLVLIE
jgi:hypothetical protein